MALEASQLKDFYAYSRQVWISSNNLPAIVTAPSFQETNFKVQAEIDALHGSLFTIEGATIDHKGRVSGSNFICLNEHIGEFLNDDSVANKDVKQMTKDIFLSFINLLKALDKFIKLKNTLPKQGSEKEKQVLERSFSELATILGMIIQPLNNHIKDAIDEWIYEGQNLNSLKRQMDKCFAGDRQSIRQLLHLDKTKNGKPRKNPGTTLKRKSTARAAAEKAKKKKQKQKQKDKKANRRK